MSSENSGRQSPLVQIDLAQIQRPKAQLRVHELAFQGHVNLRGSLSDPTFVEAAEEVLGVPLQMENNSFIETNECTILWYGPNEWLIITQPGKEGELIAKLRMSLKDTFSAVTDVTGGNTIIEISGTSARDLLSCGSMIDFHKREFNHGRCVQTLFAKTNVTIFQINEIDVFRMIIRRSFSDYLGAWLLDAANSLINAA